MDEVCLLIRSHIKILLDLFKKLRYAPIRRGILSVNQKAVRRDVSPPDPTSRKKDSDDA